MGPPGPYGPLGALVLLNPFRQPHGNGHGKEVAGHWHRRQVGLAGNPIRCVGIGKEVAGHLHRVRAGLAGHPVAASAAR